MPYFFLLFYFIFSLIVRLCRALSKPYVSIMPSYIMGFSSYIPSMALV